MAYGIKKNDQNIVEDIRGVQRAECNVAGPRLGVLANHFQQMRSLLKAGVYSKSCSNAALSCPMKSSLLHHAVLHHTVDVCRGTRRGVTGCDRQHLTKILTQLTQILAISSNQGACLQMRLTDGCESTEEQHPVEISKFLVLYLALILSMVFVPSSSFSAFPPLL